ncbi:hypothetical protein Tco_1144368 [Tanacetum coccineum]
MRHRKHLKGISAERPHFQSISARITIEGMLCLDLEIPHTFATPSVGIPLGHLGGASPCAAGRLSYLLASRQKHPGPEIIAHSIGMTLLLRIVTVPPFTGNFNISLCVMAYGTDLSYTHSSYYSIVLDGDLIYMKFIHAEMECSSSHIFTSRDIWPIGQIVSPLNPMSDVVTGIIWLLISGWSLAKQCSYRTFEDAPPSMYIRYTKCPIFQLR